MFRAEMSEKLKSIFGMKVTFNAPGSFEQDTLFVQVEQCRARPTTGRISARVDGYLTMYAQVDKAPFGFFAKKIEHARAEDKKAFLFTAIDEDLSSSEARMQNISERRTRFVYLTEQQYNPAKPWPLDTEVEFDQFSYVDVGDGRILGTGTGPAVEVETP